MMDFIIQLLRNSVVLIAESVFRFVQHIQKQQSKIKYKIIIYFKQKIRKS